MSLVDKPAEPNARVALFKRDESEDWTPADEMFVEEMIEVGKAQPSSSDVSTYKPLGGRGGKGDVKIRLRGKEKYTEDDEKKKVKKDATMGAVYEAEIHRNFTNLADGMYATGRLTREERIALSSAIGDALDAFSDRVSQSAPQLYDRSPYEDSEGEMEKASREFSTETREDYASRGIALPDGSFPIPDKDALRRAIASYGRADIAKRPAVIAHIKRRAKALGATDMIPESFAKLGDEGLADDESVGKQGQDKAGSSDGPHPAEVDKMEGTMPEDNGIDLSTIPEEVRGEVEEFIASLTKRAEDAESEVTLLKSVEKTDEEKEAELLKSADPAIRKMVEDAQAEAAEANSIAKAERESRLNREFLEKAASLPFVPGETQEKADILKAASESLTAEQYGALEKMLRGANDSMKASGIFKVNGSGQNTEGAEGRIESLAKARAEEKEITYEQAYDEILTENPDLYERSEAETVEVN